MGKLFGAIAALLMIISVGVVVLLENPDRFKSQISDTVSSATGFEVSIDGELSWRYWPPIAIHASNISLNSPEGNIADLKRLEADVDLMPLLTGQPLLKVNEVIVAGGQVSLVMDESGRGNWQTSDDSVSAQTNKTGGSSTITTVESVVIEDIAVSYQDAASNQQFEADITSLTMNNFSNDAPFTMTLATVARDVNNQLESQLDARALINLRDAAGRLTFSDVAINGELRRAAQPVIPITLSLTGSYAPDAARLQLEDYQVNIGDVSLAGELVLQSADQVQINSAFTLAKTPGTAFSKLGIDLPVEHVSASGNLSGTPDTMRLTNLSGTIDETTLTGSAEFSLTHQSLMRSELRLDRINFDRYLSGTESPAGDSPTPDFDAELIPIDLLRRYELNAIVRIDEVIWQGDQFAAVKLEVAGDKRNFRLTANANGWNGKFLANADTDLRRAMTNFKLTLDQLDVTSMTAVQGLTGRITATSNLTFAGASLSDIEQSIRGRSVFTVKDGTLDITPIKSLAQLVDSLRGRQSSVADWPDRIPFNQMVGEHVMEQGLGQSQLITTDIQNLRLTAVGGISLQSESLNFDVSAMFNKPKAGELAISDQLVGIRWPLSCAGQFTDTPASLCLGREGAIKSLVADIAKQDLERRGGDKLNELIGDKIPEEYRELTRDLFKGLFKRD